jgi:hypothetical protein
MPYSTAVSAQKTAIFIEGNAGASLSITAVSNTSPAVFTASNTLSVGQVVELGAVVGMDVAGTIGFVTAASGSSFSLGIDLTGYAAGGGAGSAVVKTFIKVKNTRDYSGFDGAATDIDVTNFDSDGMEHRAGLPDGGQLAFNLDVSDADAGQLALRAARASGAVLTWLVVLSNGYQRAFKGYCKKFSEQGAVNGVVKGSADVRINWPVRYYSVATVSGPDSRPRFGVAPAAATFTGATILALLTPISGSANGGKVGGFTLPLTTAGNAGWVAVLASNSAVTFTDSIGGVGAWSGANSAASNYSGADTTPTTASQTYTDPGTGLAWRFFRENYVNAHPSAPAAFTIS